MASLPVNCEQRDLAGSPRAVEQFPDESFDASFSRKDFFRKYCQETNRYTKRRLKGLSDQELQKVEAAIREKQLPSTQFEFRLRDGVSNQVQSFITITKFEVQKERDGKWTCSLSIEPYDEFAPIKNVSEDKDLGEYGRKIAKHGMMFQTNEKEENPENPEKTVTVELSENYYKAGAGIEDKVICAIYKVKKVFCQLFQSEKPF